MRISSSPRSSATSVVIFAPHVSPDSLPAVESFTYVIVAVVGGLGTCRRSGRSGVRVGSPAVLNTVSSQPGLPPAVEPIIQYATFGAVLVLALLFMPRGFLPPVDEVGDRITARGSGATA
jgi:branched-chain amino acid transport system permease protein